MVEALHEIKSVPVQSRGLKDVEDIVNIVLRQSVWQDCAGQIGVTMAVKVDATQHLVHYRAVLISSRVFCIQAR